MISPHDVWCAVIDFFQRSCSACGDVSMIVPCTRSGCELGLCVELGENTSGCILLPDGISFDDFARSFICPQCYRPGLPPYQLKVAGVTRLHERVQTVSSFLVCLWYATPTFRDAVLSCARMTLGADAHNVRCHPASSIPCLLTVFCPSLSLTILA